MQERLRLRTLYLASFNFDFNLDLILNYPLASISEDKQDIYETTNFLPTKSLISLLPHRYCHTGTAIATQ